jgi:hypothetical protein
MEAIPLHLKPRPARFVLALLTMSASLAVAAPVQAGTYTQYTCRLPDGGIAATDGWEPEHARPGFLQGNYCANAGVINTQMSGGGISTGSGRSWTWRAPTGTQVESARLSRAFALASGDGEATPVARVHSGLTDIEAHGSSAPFGDGVSTRGSMTNPDSLANILSITNPSTQQISLRVECNGFDDRVCPNLGTSELRLHSATFTLRDSTSPTVSNVQGSLTTAGEHRGVESLSFDAADTGAGIYRTIVKVDGLDVVTSIVDANGGKCADAVPATPDPYEFEHRVPCRLTTGGAVSLDTRLLSDGLREVEVIVEDAAGNRSAVFGPRQLRIANAAQPPSTVPPATTTGGQPTTTPGGPPNPAPIITLSVNGIGGGQGARITASRHGSSRRTVRLRYGSRVTLSGKLVDRRGRPIAGAVVDVLAKTRIGGARMAGQGTVTTSRDGVFRYVAPTGPSRLVRFAYRAHLEDTDYSQTTDVDLRVKGSVSLRLNRTRMRNRQTLTYSGRLAGPHTAKRLVEVKVRSGPRWRVVCVARTNARGAYRCRHRFTQTFRPWTYTFRTDVRKQVGLPYEPTVSAVRKVRVRP